MAAKTDSAKRSHDGARRGSRRHRRSKYINARMVVSLHDETYRRWTALHDSLPQTESHKDLAVLLLDAFDNCRLDVACSSTY